MDRRELWRRLRRRILKPLFFIFTALLGVWSIGAVYYTFGWSGFPRNAGTVGYAVLLAGLWGCSFRLRPCRGILAAVEFAVLIYFLVLTPGMCFRDTVWQQPWRRNPTVEFDGSRVTIRNVRDFHYRTAEEYTPDYTTLRLDLDLVRTVDLAVSHWDGLQRIAHTMLSFGFADGQYLAVSMETRLPEGAVQGFLPGIYKQYELLMVLATEEDLFRLRTDFRGEELYFYRTNATPEQARAMLEPLLHGVNLLKEKPQFYNSVTRNCTTSLAPLLRIINPSFEGDIRLLLNGFSDQLLYELGYLACRDGESFAELKARRKANLYVKDAGDDYSKALRTNL